MKASTETVVMSQKRLDPFAAFNKSSQTVQGQIPARQNSRGLDRDGVEYQAEDRGRRLANTVQVKRSEVGAGRRQSE